MPAKAPRFHLQAATSSALVACWEDHDRWRPCASEQAEQLVQKLRCTVCHPRDANPAELPLLLAEEGDLGLIPESLPNLTWTGEKLQADWMRRFLAGEIAERPRPTLTARMPAFPHHATTLAQGLAAQHGVAPQPENSSAEPASPEALWTGHRLTQKNGGLDCRQCHAVGSQPAQGDDKTRLAPGINFAMVARRLRPEFYRRFVLDPPRYDVTTRMPKLAPDGQHTPLREVYDGDARRQFEAIWTYLQTVPGGEP